MITFAHRPETICPLTLSHSVLLGMLDAEQVRSTPDEAETNLSDPVASGAPQRLATLGRSVRSSCRRRMASTT